MIGRLALRDRLVDDSGVTLVEVLVTMLLVATVAGGVTQSVVSALAAQGRQVEQAEALSGARTAFERMTRDIRQADPVRLATAERLDVEVTRSGVRRLDAYSLVEPVPGSPVLTHARTETILATGATSSSTQPLLENVLPASGATFRYYETDGTEIVATPMTPIDVRLIRRVTVTLRLALPDSTHVVDLSTTITLRNRGA